MTFCTFEQHSEYLLARGLLESAGIECFRRDEHSNSTLLFSGFLFLACIATGIYERQGRL